MSDQKAFRDGIQAAIHLLSTSFPTTLGRYCSSATLRSVTGPSVTQQLYISVLQDHLNDPGSYEDGIGFAVELLRTKMVGRDPDIDFEWILVDTDNPSVGNQLFMVELERLVNPGG